MAQRDRRRAERRKRKERGAARRAELAARREAMAARSEERNRQERRRLEPLTAGERPAAVTVGAWVSVVVAIVFWASVGIAAFTDVEVSGEEPNVVQLVAVAAVCTLMAWGMFRARYWAVLGFQALLVLVLLSAVLGLVAATTIAQALGTTLILALAGLLFFHMIKAMARIQMPDRRPPG